MCDCEPHDLHEDVDDACDETRDEAAPSTFWTDNPEIFQTTSHTPLAPFRRATIANVLDLSGWLLFLLAESHASKTPGSVLITANSHQHGRQYLGRALGGLVSYTGAGIATLLLARIAGGPSDLLLPIAALLAGAIIPVALVRFES
jgi:hypothetical protein